MTTARSGLAYLLAALLAWTSIAAGVFAPSVSHAAASSAAVHASTPIHHHGSIYGAAAVHPVSATAQSVSPESACVASCLDVIAAKLAPPPHERVQPGDDDGAAIAWPPLALLIAALTLVDYRPRATGPPEPALSERSGAARLLRANARLRI